MSEERHATLVEQATQGDGDALDALLERHLPNLLTYVRLHAGPLLLGKESAIDLVQSVCRQVLGELDRFEYRGEPAFRKWLFTTALNKIRKRHRYWRAEGRDPRREAAPAGSTSGFDLGALAVSYTTPSRVAIAEEDMARLEHAFDQLSDDDKKVITLSRILDLPHRDVAQELGRSEGATRVMLHRALYRLGALLKQERHKG